jgi:hypothetical protein
MVVLFAPTAFVIRHNRAQGTTGGSLVGRDDKWTWGVVGVGRAGRARAAAIQNDSRCDLMGVSRGHFAAEFDVPNLSLLDLLNQVDAVAICSPTAVHVEQIRKALEAGCQTVVEFPIARRAGEARELFKLAQSEGFLLHVGHIELLLGWHHRLRERLSGELKVDMRMTKAGSGRETAEDLFGACVARLHNVSYLSPIMSVGNAHWSPGCLELGLRLKNGDASVSIRSGPNLSRQTELDVQDKSAMWTVRGRRLYRSGKEVQGPISKRSLFDQDHQHVMARLNEGKEPYVSEQRVLNVLDHVETIRSLLERGTVEYS